MAGGIFISYRRDDAAHVTGRMADALGARVGRERVFVDVDSVAPGEDFVRKIEATIRDSDTFLAVIGANWLSAKGPNGQRRIDLEGDFIRLEVKSALASGMRIIPVLVDGASMPRAEDLPEDVRQLVRHNAVFINHATFARDMQAVIEQLGLPAPKDRAMRINPLALPVGAGVVLVGLLAFALWPNGPSPAPALASSISLGETEEGGNRWITHTQFKAERGAEGRLSIRAELPYRDRMADEKRIDGLEFLDGSPLASPTPEVLVQVTNSTDKPIAINEIQFGVVKADPDMTPVPVLREHRVDYHRVRMINEGWGPLEAPRLTVRAWGRPEADFDRSQQAWKGEIRTWEPCAEPRGRVETTPVVVEGVSDGDGVVFDLEGRLPGGFGKAIFVCAIGELSYTYAGKTETLAVRTRVSNRRPDAIVAAPALDQYDLYLDPDREGYVAVVPLLQELAPGETVTLPVRIYTDQSSDFQLSQSVRTAAGEIIPGEAFGLQIFVSRNYHVGRLLRERMMLIPPSAIAAVDKEGMVESAIYHLSGEDTAQFYLREDPAKATCEAFLKDAVPRIFDKIGMQMNRVEINGPSGFSCGTP